MLFLHSLFLNEGEVFFPFDSVLFLQFLVFELEQLFQNFVVLNSSFLDSWICGVVEIAESALLLLVELTVQNHLVFFLFLD